MSLFVRQIQRYRVSVESGEPLSITDLKWAVGAERVVRYQAAVAQAKIERAEEVKYPVLMGQAADYQSAAEKAFQLYSKQPKTPKIPLTKGAREGEFKDVGEIDHGLPAQWRKYNQKRRAISAAAEAASEYWAEVPKEEHRNFTIWHPWDKTYAAQTSGDPRWDDMEFPLPLRKSKLEMNPQPHLLDPVRFFQLEALDEVLLAEGAPLPVSGVSASVLENAERLLARAREANR